MYRDRDVWIYGSVGEQTMQRRDDGRGIGVESSVHGRRDEVDSDGRVQLGDGGEKGSERERMGRVYPEMEREGTESDGAGEREWGQLLVDVHQQRIVSVVLHRWGEY